MFLEIIKSINCNTNYKIKYFQKTYCETNIVKLSERLFPFRIIFHIQRDVSLNSNFTPTIVTYNYLIPILPNFLLLCYCVNTKI